MELLVQDRELALKWWNAIENTPLQKKLIKEYFNGFPATGRIIEKVWKIVVQLEVDNLYSKGDLLTILELYNLYCIENGYIIPEEYLKLNLISKTNNKILTYYSQNELFSKMQSYLAYCYYNHNTSPIKWLMVENE